MTSALQLAHSIRNRTHRGYARIAGVDAYIAKVVERMERTCTLTDDRLVVAARAWSVTCPPRFRQQAHVSRIQRGGELVIVVPNHSVRVELLRKARRFCAELRTRGLPWLNRLRFNVSEPLAPSAGPTTEPTEALQC